MAQFTNVGYGDMHFKYCFREGNGRAALMEYQCQYADQTQPNPTSLRKQMQLCYQHTLAMADTMCRMKRKH
jgi:hypothetical protein